MSNTIKNKKERERKSQGRAGDLAQVVEHLAGKHKALSSNSTTTKKKERAKTSSYLEAKVGVLLDPKSLRPDL
jgi:hypothetical protein